MTKVEAVREFRAEVLPFVRKNDIGAKREAWNNFTDQLLKEGRIASWQYMTWVSPFPS